MSYDATVVENGFDYEDPGMLRLWVFSTRIVVHVPRPRNGGDAWWQQTARLVLRGVRDGVRRTYTREYRVERTPRRPTSEVRFRVHVADTVEPILPSRGFLQREPLPGAADFHIIAVPGRNLRSQRHPWAVGYTETYLNVTGGHGIRRGSSLRDHDLIGGRAAWVPFASVNDQNDYAVAHEMGHGVFGLLHPVENEYPIPGYEHNLMALGFVPSPPDTPEFTSGQIAALVNAAEQALAETAPLGPFESQTDWGRRVDGASARRVATDRYLR